MLRELYRKLPKPDALVMVAPYDAGEEVPLEEQTITAFGLSRVYLIF